MAVKMFDAAHLPPSLPQGFKIAGGYIPSPFANHVWSPQDWKRCNGMAKLPIYVASLAVGKEEDPKSEAFDCLRWLYETDVPHGQVIALDLEEAVNPGWVLNFGQVIQWAGYYVWPYGSADFVMKNPVLDGYWVAQWKTPRTPFMYPSPLVKATQWTDGPVFDQSLVKWWSYRLRFKKW